jgi:hypothetical protein
VADDKAKNNSRPSFSDLLKTCQRDQDQKPITPKMSVILQILQSDLVLVQPCLEWLLGKQAELSRAKLIALYGVERYNQMVKDAQKKSG